MILDFDAMEEIVTPNFFGGEKEYRSRMVIDAMGKILRGTLVPGASIGMHTHETNCEVMYIVEGTATVWYQGERIIMHPGEVHYCPKGHSHSLINEGDTDLVFFAVVPNQM